MKDYSNPRARLPYLCVAAAQCIDQMHDRVMSEYDSHICNSDSWVDGSEPTVELSLDEAALMVGNLNQIAHLLRKVSEVAA